MNLTGMCDFSRAGDVLALCYTSHGTDDGNNSVLFTATGELLPNDFQDSIKSKDRNAVLVAFGQACMSAHFMGLPYKKLGPQHPWVFTHNSLPQVSYPDRGVVLALASSQLKKVCYGSPGNGAFFTIRLFELMRTSPNMTLDNVLQKLQFVNRSGSVAGRVSTRIKESLFGGGKNNFLNLNTSDSQHAVISSSRRDVDLSKTTIRDMLNGRITFADFGTSGTELGAQPAIAQRLNVAMRT